MPVFLKKSFLVNVDVLNLTQNNIYFFSFHNLNPRKKQFTINKVQIYYIKNI